MPPKDTHLEDDPLWYRDAILYQLHVKAFYDGNGDGIGDFKGLTEKLDYLADLGVTAVWILPFYPSPLRDDGYDIADCFNVNPDYGTLKEFKEFLKEAHQRGIRVVTELVLNHTSDQHAWFQRARKSEPGSIWRDFYVWSDTPEKYQDARIIFKDFEASNWSWDPVAKAYYWHRFYSHQPDLNFENPHVQKAMMRVMDYWLNMGVDGLRLDAIPYLYEREGTNCENLPETYDYLKKLRARVDGKFKNKMLLAEANQWPEDAAAYFGKGDACHMAFHFPLMPRIFMSVRMEDRFPIIDILEQTPALPEGCQWAIFLRNHDELTLEMVTDEERDYMYRIYARDPKMRINLGIRRRLAPLLENDRRKIELMNVLLFSLPGTPVIYYGDEIGMGDNYYLGDRNGVRTPMQWSGDRNAGFSKANPHKLYLPAIIDPEYHYEAVNVENQQRNQSSLLWNMKHLIATRKHFKAFGRGSIEFVSPENPKVLAFIRQYQNETILVVVNLSRHSQIAELDLSRFSGFVPQTLFSKNKFPMIKEGCYLITLTAYGYFRFLLRKEEASVERRSEERIPALRVSFHWENVLQEKAREKLEREILPAYLLGCRWFGGKARPIHRLRIAEAIAVGRDASASRLLLLEVQYIEGLSETYLLPVSFASGEKREKILEDAPQGVIARLTVGEEEGVLYEAVYDDTFRRTLLWMISKKYHARGDGGELVATQGKEFKELAARISLPLESQVLKADQSNTSLLYGDKLFFKFYRRLDEGMNPDLEIGKFLTEGIAFPHVPPYAGAIEYRRPGAQPIVIGILQGYVPNQGDAWRYTVDAAGRYFERVLSARNEVAEIPKAPDSILQIAYQEIPPLLQELLGGVHLEMATLLGKRTAEFHLALASNRDDPDFAPEPYTMLYQRSLYQSMQSRARQVLQLLRKNMSVFPEEVGEKAREVLGFEKEIMARFKAIYQTKISTMKIRIHGDYHLGQVLYTGNDFFLIDFEGEPAKALSERRLKRSPFRDVVGMIRSFHYKAYTTLITQAWVRPEDVPVLEPWADLWFKYISATFLRSYLDTAKEALFIPKEPKEIEILLNVFLLDKALYEIAYELNNRPEWIAVPLKGIKHLLEVPNEGG